MLDKVLQSYNVPPLSLSLLLLPSLYIYGYQPPNPIRISLQGTGWSALHFLAERGDWDTTRGLLEAGASPHLKDKVCGVADIIFLHLLSISLHYCRISLSITVVSLSPLPVKNGLTAMEIAEVRAEEGEEGRPYNEYEEDEEERPEYDYEGVISLLRKYCAEEPTTTPSHHVSITMSLITKL